MVSAPDESYYADQYWRIISPHLERLPQEARILDLGCGQGRFTIRLGRLFPRGKLLGCDLSNEAIAQARVYAARDSVDNIDFRVQPISECLAEFGGRTADVVLLVEVSFFYPQWK